MQFYSAITLVLTFLVLSPAVPSWAGAPYDTPDPANAASPPVEVKIDSDGRVYYHDQVVAVDQLATALQASGVATSSVITVFADPAMSSGRLAEVVQPLAAAGYARTTVVNDTPPVAPVQ